MDIKQLTSIIADKYKISIIFLAVIFSIVVGVSFFSAPKMTQTTSHYPPHTPTKEVFSSPPLHEQPLSTSSNNNDQPLRNPFGPPAASIAPQSSQAVNTMKQNATNNNNFSLKDTSPKLTGIVNSNDSYVAIIEYNGRSHYVKADDIVGSYKTVKITLQEALLSGPNGELILQLGR